MTRHEQYKKEFFKQLFADLEEEYYAGNISLKYVKRILSHYGLDVKKLSTKVPTLAHRGVFKKEPRHHNKNPQYSNNGLVKIYDKVQAIEAQRHNESIWPSEDFRHDFKSKSHGEIYGVPLDGILQLSNGIQIKVYKGSLLIQSKNGKKLFDWFKYDSNVDGSINK